MIGDVTRLFDLSGKVAVVTGAGSGLGEGIAEGYAQMGASVVVVDIVPEAAQRVAAGIHQAGGTAVATECDVSQGAQVQRVVDRAVEVFGKVDVLMANAGMAKAMLKAALPRIAQAHRECACGSALEGAFITRPEAIPPERREMLELLIGKYLQ